MADAKITELDAFAEWASGDLFVGVDVSDTSMDAAGTTKKSEIGGLVFFLDPNKVVDGSEPTPPTNGAGGALFVYGATGSSAVGDSLIFRGGTGDVGYGGGNLNLSGGTGGAGSGGAGISGGYVVVYGGAGGAGDTDFDGGAGANITIQSGAGGAGAGTGDGGASGNVCLVLGEPGAGDPAGEYGNLLFQQVASGVPTTFATFNRTSGVESVCFGPTNGSNVASGLESIVLCGNNLTASGDFSACVAGTSSAASGDYAGTFVGYGNTASALYGACVGGHSNTASTGDDAICAGGSGNSSTGAQSSTVGSASSTASGLRSVVAGGYTLESSGTDSSCVGGNTNTASGDNSSCLGGTGTTASATGAMALGGCETVADHYAEVVNGGPKFSVAGDNQHSLLFLSNSTTDDTQTELFLDKASLQLTIPENTTCGFCAHILARRTDADGESAYYRIEGCIANDAGTTALVGSITKTVIAEDTAAWDVTAEADDTNDALVFKVTGEVDKVIYWNCSVSLNKITG